MSGVSGFSGVSTSKHVSLRPHHSLFSIPHLPSSVSSYTSQPSQHGYSGYEKHSFTAFSHFDGMTI